MNAEFSIKLLCDVICYIFNEQTNIHREMGDGILLRWAPPSCRRHQPGNRPWLPLQCVTFFFLVSWTRRKRNSSVTYQNFSSYSWETFQRTFHNHRLTRRMDNNYLKSTPPNTVRLHEDSTYATLLALGRFQTTWFPSQKKFFLLNLVFVTKCVRKAIWTNIF